MMNRTETSASDLLEMLAKAEAQGKELERFMLERAQRKIQEVANHVPETN